MTIVSAAAAAKWGDLNLGEADLGVMAEVVEAIEGTLADTHNLPTIDEAHPAPAGLVIAIKMLAVKGYGRRKTPGGIAGFGADFVYRVSKDDPEIADRLAPYQAFRVG